MTAKGNGQAERCPGQSRTQSRPVGGTAYRPRPGRRQPTGSKKGTLMLKRSMLLAFNEPERKRKPPIRREPETRPTKRHAGAEKTNAFGLWRAGGERKNLRLAGNQRQDRRKRHADAEKANSYCLWRARGEKENLRLAENRRKCRRKIIRWRIGFGTAGRRTRLFPAAAGDCPAR